MSDEIRKNLDIPFETVEILAAVANSERMSVKAYMESVLIAHAKYKQLAVVSKGRKSARKQSVKSLK